MGSAILLELYSTVNVIFSFKYMYNRRTTLRLSSAAAASHARLLCIRIAYLIHTRMRMTMGIIHHETYWLNTGSLIDVPRLWKSIEILNILSVSNGRTIVIGCRRTSASVCSAPKWLPLSGRALKSKQPKSVTQRMQGSTNLEVPCSQVDSLLSRVMNPQAN